MGKKRHKLIGRKPLDSTPIYTERNKKKKIGIIGTGIAATSAAYAAAQNGANVEMFESADVLLLVHQVIQSLQCIKIFNK